MLELLINNPTLLLFLVAAVGYPLGRIKVAGFSLGISAVLFTGIAFGALHPDLKLPEFVQLFGLSVFVYTIGLASGPGFFASMRRRGLRDNAFTIAIIAAAGLMTAALKLLLGFGAPLAAGVFAGALTNAPGLASVLETVKATHAASLTGQALERALADPVVAFSVTYPMGVVAMLLVIFLMERFWRIDYAAEARAMGAGEPITRQSVRVTAAGDGRRVADVAREAGGRVVFGRWRHEGQVRVAEGEAVLRAGDSLTVIGTASTVQAATALLGVPSDDALENDRSEMDFRRIFVSNPRVAGQRLSGLGLPARFGALVTRVRRGDVEFLASGETTLELGDRVRVVAPRDRLDEVSRYFGDSYRALSEIDIITFSIGIAVGLLLGVLPVPLPGGATFRLGFAGGPLVVSLILGWRGRTGPLLWQIPYSANLTLRQLGLILFLAGIGTRSGYAFASSFGGGNGPAVFLAGAVVTTLVAWVALWIGYRLLKVPFSLLTGMLAGMQTQPAVLAYASERAGSDLPNIGYASTYPMGTIAKIVGAQIVLMLLQR